MSELTEHTDLGCAVCNPDFRPPRDKASIAQERAAISARMHIARMGDGYHVLEIPGRDEAPFETWPGPFESDAAARLFRDDVIDAHVGGYAYDVCSSSGIFEHFNRAGRILEYLEKHDGDNRTLATRMAAEQPWEARKPSNRSDNPVPWE